MRADQNIMTGNVGESEVTVRFERLGWGVAPNPRHDVGTDLWLMARDERLFDLGLVVGAQVKSGPTWFSKPKRAADKSTVGWWFNDRDRRHVDAWLAHGLPHIVVLHDDTTGISYWVHVTPDAVVDTGKGAKILVPAANTLDEAHRDELVRVAATGRPAGDLEGSAWAGGQSLQPDTLLRHALIVPRLVAPHPNADHSRPVTAAQALAMLVQARLSDLMHRSEANETVPTLGEALDSDEWDWRLVGALGQRVTTGEHDLLVAASADAPDPARRTAASVAAAAALVEDGQAADAVAVLDAALAHDDAGPVDHAWLQVQKARACAEMGLGDQALSLAAQAQAVGATHAGDVTATAMAGASAALLFDLSAWDSRDLAGVITGADTASAWWRTQTVSRGLTALAERTFRDWSRDPSVTFRNGDPVSDQLLSAALTASHAGDHGTWRHLTGLLGQDALLRVDRKTAPDAAADALRQLLAAGDPKDVVHALRRLGTDGPAAAVRLVGSGLDLDVTTRTTAPTALALLQHGGDLLDQDDADRATRWLLATLDEPSIFAQRTRPIYWLVERLVDTLAGVVLAAGDDVQQLVAERLARLPGEQDELTARGWARLVESLPARAWTPDLAAMAGENAERHDGVLRDTLLSVAGEHHGEVRDQLLAHARQGDLGALAALGDVTRIPSDVTRRVVRDLARHMREEIAHAESGVRHGYDLDHVAALAVLDVNLPDVAEWPPLLELLAHPAVPRSSKAGALRRLAAVADRVPDDVRDGLLAAARAAADQEADPHASLFARDGDSPGPAGELVAALAPPEPTRLLALLGGDADDRASAARIHRRLGRDEDAGLLIALAFDPHPRVRAAAAAGLAGLAAADRGGPAVHAALARAAVDPGRLVPQAVAGVLASHTGVLPAAAQAVLDGLRLHVSARVRDAATLPAHD